LDELQGKLLLQNWPVQWLSLNQDIRGRYQQDNIHHTWRTLWICCYAFWFNKCISHFSAAY
jgi:hypothetical protein